jgi:hypothetical protein
MGDYTNNGIKLGTCGKAYYATKSMIEALPTDAETKYYLNPKNKCMFAFPLPEFDNKKAGDISIFHKEQRDLTVIQINKKHKTFHGNITHHIHPVGGQGVNLFCECPYHSTEKTSRFNDETIKFYLKYETFTGEGEEMAIVGECIYCGETNIFEKHEAEEAAENLYKKSLSLLNLADRPEYKNTSNRDSYIKQAEELEEVANRILKTYNTH